MKYIVYTFSDGTVETFPLHNDPIFEYYKDQNPDKDGNLIPLPDGRSITSVATGGYDDEN
jgi:hypothetical protein